MNFNQGKIMLLSSSTSSGEMRCVYDCKYFEGDKGVYIEYNEDEEKEAITSITISQNSISVKKNGELKSHMLFEKGKTNKTAISTLYGDIHIKLFTRDFEVKKIGNKLTIFIDYDIYYVGNERDNTKLSINLLIKDL